MTWFYRFCEWYYRLMARLLKAVAVAIIIILVAACLLGPIVGAIWGPSRIEAIVVGVLIYSALLCGIGADAADRSKPA